MVRKDREYFSNGKMFNKKNAKVNVIISKQLINSDIHTGDNPVFIPSSVHSCRKISLQKSAYH